MVKLQLSNYIITLEDDRIIINNVASTWKLEISILNSRYQLLSYMINNPEMHKILEGYCYINYLVADNTFIDSTFIKEFTESYNGNFKRHNAIIKQLEKEGKGKAPKVKSSKES